MKILQTQPSKWKELLCILFGHNWYEYGSTTNNHNTIMEEYNTCERCGLRNHRVTGCGKVEFAYEMGIDLEKP